MFASVLPETAKAKAAAWTPPGSAVGSQGRWTDDVWSAGLLSASSQLFSGGVEGISRQGKRAVSEACCCCQREVVFTVRLCAGFVSGSGGRCLERWRGARPAHGRRLCGCWALVWVPVAVARPSKAPFIWECQRHDVHRSPAGRDPTLETLPSPEVDVWLYDFCSLKAIHMETDPQMISAYLIYLSQHAPVEEQASHNDLALVVLLSSAPPRSVPP